MHTRPVPYPIADLFLHGFGAVAIIAPSLLCQILVTRSMHFACSLACRPIWNSTAPQPIPRGNLRDVSLA